MGLETASSHFASGITTRIGELDAGCRRLGANSWLARLIPRGHDISCPYNGGRACAYTRLLEVFEAAELGFEAEEVDGKDLDYKEGDHQGDYAGYAVRAEEEDYEERGEDGGGTANGVAEAESAHADVGGKEFGDVDGEEQGDQNVDADDEEKA